MHLVVELFCLPGVRTHGTAGDWGALGSRPKWGRHISCHPSNGMIKALRLKEKKSFCAFFSALTHKWAAVRELGVKTVLYLLQTATNTVLFKPLPTQAWNRVFQSLGRSGLQSPAITQSPVVQSPWGLRIAAIRLSI